ncbi:hypothetical protein [Eremococcus coleocola]|uniref:hypothetical protein n=1 Tax=Eremococcus coleocola TaxID=88132 RepID=UPI000421A86E|nr:hypothetical protein [Eremococcus coleocola]
MKKTYDLKGNKRKALCAVISKVTGEKATYLGPPSFAYQIGDIKVGRDATVENISEEIHQALLEAGFEELPLLSEEPEKDTEPAMEISAPSFSVAQPLLNEEDLGKLDNLLKAKGPLIQKALQADQITYEIGDDKLIFRWFNQMPEPETIQATIVLIDKIVQHVINRKFISAKLTETDNEKYTFRTFLLSLGLIGPEYKEVRKTLMRHLSGNAAFRKPQKTNK